jgi:hypothetical protein
MTAARLLGELRAAGVILTAAGGKLRYGGPSGVLTGEVLAEMRTHKAGLLALLAAEAAPRPDVPTSGGDEPFEKVGTEPGASPPLVRPGSLSRLPPADRADGRDGHAAREAPPPAEDDPFRGAGPGGRRRIPLDELVYGDFLARHRLRIVGGTAYPDGHTFRPTLYLADDTE